MGVRAALLVTLATLVGGGLTQPSSAADRVFWTNGAPPNVISFASLDGSGGGNLAMPGGGRGLALDLSGGRIYWAQGSPNNKISFATLDGTGVVGDLPTGAATVDNPAGLAIDPVARRIYWANNFGNKISFASLDGSGGGDLPTGLATLVNPDGVAIDLAARRIYWTNAGANKISHANLDGSSGGDLPTGAATVDTPRGPAIDPVGGRIYWSNLNGISFASLDGSGTGGNLATTGASGPFPLGLAIDPAAGRIYFANGNKISYARLDGTGGGNDLPTSGANVNSPSYPALVKVPNSTGAPVISGDSAPGSVLSCSQGLWASDLFGANLYQQLQSFTHQWSRGGTDIAGATDSSYTADVPGEYRCAVTASNIAGAGAASARSEPFVVTAPPSNGIGFEPPNDITFGKLKRNAARGIATLVVNVPGEGELTVGGRGVASQRSSQRTGAQAKAVGPPWQVSVKIKPTGRAKKRLTKKGKLTLKVTITFTPTGGNANTEAKRVKLIKR